MLKSTVTKISEGSVALSFSDGQTIHVPVEACEGEPTVGAMVNVLFVVPGAEDSARQALSKNILNELIGSSDINPNS